MYTNYALQCYFGPKKETQAEKGMRKIDLIADGSQYLSFPPSFRPVFVWTPNSLMYLWPGHLRTWVAFLVDPAIDMQWNLVNPSLWNAATSIAKAASFAGQWISEVLWDLAISPIQPVLQVPSVAGISEIPLYIQYIFNKRKFFLFPSFSLACVYWTSYCLLNIILPFFFHSGLYTVY